MFRYFILSFIVVAFIFLFNNCSKKSEKVDEMSSISQKTIEQTIKILIDSVGENQKFRIERGVKQVALFWKKEDGTEKDFTKFCVENFVKTDEELEKVFQKLSFYSEVLAGHFNKITLELNRTLHLDIGEIHPIDLMFAAYSPSAHLQEDFFKNKIAFYILLNFPHYSLQEKLELGKSWDRKQWAYARLGDAYTSRTPAELLQKISEVMTNADNYISNYNIYVGYLFDDKGKDYFPKEKKLISHWNLRDELKSQYKQENGLQKQRLIYEVMKRIITQEIPEVVINSDKYYWNPYTNKVIQDGKEISAKPEPNTRYQHLLNNFLAQKAIDKYNPYYNNYIKRKFEEEFEIPVEQVEQIFISLVSSPTVKQVAELIKKRLNRDLEPFDIWYDGFKTRNTIPEDELNTLTLKKYPTKEHFKEDMPRILKFIGFTSEDANFIASKIEVEPARGAGHAWGAQMRSEKAHLRTRLTPQGMDYKGYNIAIHELGHNVEQTITLQNVDYYLLTGVPNTAFTEAWAFIFQGKDLEMLGYKNQNQLKDHLYALDNFWSSYEIMGVSLVDINVWRWLYKNPNATAEQLKNQVIAIAKDIWNKYYADVFGVKDQPILAIYSHMIDYPLYLSAYPLGHLIEFQILEYAKGKNLGSEMKRMLTQGRITPQQWMLGAVGKDLSAEPLINSANEALKYIK